VLSRLRSETRDQHDAIERTLVLMDDSLTLDAYRQRLEQFFGYYQPVEQCLFGADSPLADWVPLQQRRKTHLLEADLATLGVQAAQQLPICGDLPPLASVADYFGCMYVLEGASLGGVLISRHIRATLNVTPEAGGKFFYGYGEQTGAMWHDFRSAISAFSIESADHDAVVASARATFETLQRWCEGNR
jgi:heme oxygenase